MSFDRTRFPALRIGFVSFALGLLLTATSAVEKEGTLVLQSLRQTADIEITTGETDVRFVVSEAAASGTAAYLLLDGIANADEASGDWVSARFTSYATDGSATGEQGWLVFPGQIPVESDTSIVTSNVVGIVPVSANLGDATATPLVSEREDPEAVNVVFRHGRLVVLDGAMETVNVGYTVNNTPGLSTESFAPAADYAAQAYIFRNADRGLFSTGLVSGRTGDPTLSLSVTGLRDSDADGIADVVDTDYTYWETGPVYGENWRFTDFAPEAASALGVIFEKRWPWIYVPDLMDGRWVYMHDANEDRDEFWGYINGNGWVYFYLGAGQWYYDRATQRWYRF